jgi:thioredoxin 2
VDFWAPWCAPCRGFAPTFKAAAGRFAGQAIFAKVDTEAQPALGQQFNIRAIPTLVTFAGGREAGRVSGALPAGELDRLIRQMI